MRFDAVIVKNPPTVTAVEQSPSLDLHPAQAEEDCRADGEAGKRASRAPAMRASTGLWVATRRRRDEAAQAADLASAEGAVERWQTMLPRKRNESATNQFV